MLSFDHLNGESQMCRFTVLNLPLTETNPYKDRSERLEERANIGVDGDLKREPLGTQTLREGGLQGWKRRRRKSSMGRSLWRGS